MNANANAHGNETHLPVVVSLRACLVHDKALTLPNHSHNPIIIYTTLTTLTMDKFQLIYLRRDTRRLIAHARNHREIIYIFTC
jgi:hypothetical protein